MRPYYENGGVTLYLGDCAEWKGSYDLLLTDPPYGQEFKSGKSDKWGAIEGDSDSQGVLERLQIVIQGLKRGRHAYIFGSRLDLSALPLCGITTLIWDKGMIGMGDLSSPWGPQHEEITFAVYELSKANRNKGYGNLAARLRKGSVLRSLRANSGSVRFHPMEKPVDILRQMVESSSMIGETVLDPFCGSGSVLLAAQLEGRVAIGIEIDERYCEIAAKRIEGAMAPAFKETGQVRGWMGARSQFDLGD